MYRPAQLRRPPGTAVMRGAAAATAGSAKCAASRSIQPGPGRQSLSRKATSSLVTLPSPVFRAAPGRRWPAAG